MSESYIGMEAMEPDGYLQPKRYRIRAECLICGEEYSWVTTKLDGKDKPHGKRSCRDFVAAEQAEKERANFTKMIEEGRPPAHIGDKTIVKAIDTTADIVMTDHKLTNLQDNIRQGESMAPKLAPPMQKAADAFFSGGQPGGMVGSSKQNTYAARRMNALGHRAIQGSFRQTAVDPGEIFRRSGRRAGEPALRSLGQDPISKQP